MHHYWCIGPFPLCHFQVTAGPPPAGESPGTTEDGDAFIAPEPSPRKAPPPLIRYLGRANQRVHINVTATVVACGVRWAVTLARGSKLWPEGKNKVLGL